MKPLETCPGYVKGSPCKSDLQVWTPGRAKKVRSEETETLLRKPKQQSWRTWGKKNDSPA